MKAPQPIELIWDRLREPLRAFMLQKLADEALVDDLLQDLFIKVHAGMAQLRDETRIQAWIFQIARNLIHDHFRATRKALPEKQEDTLIPDSEQEYVMAQALLDMVSMMDRMPPAYCQALCMTELGGLSQKAYAEQVGISYTAAKSRVQRARQMLKDLLMRCCHYEFDRYGTVIAITPACACCCTDAKGYQQKD